MIPEMRLPQPLAAFVLPLALLIASTGQEAHAQVLVDFDPVGAQASAIGVFPTNVASGITVSDLTQTGFSGWANTNIWPVGQLGSASSTIDLTKYVTFEVSSPSPVTYEAISYSRISHTGDGNRAAAVRTSLDGFAADLDVVTGLLPDGAQQIDFDLTGLAPTAGSVEFRLYFYDAPTAGADWVDLASSNAGGTGLVLTGMASNDVGVNYCTANANSTGLVATMDGSGTTTVSDNDLTLGADNLPAFAFAFFITSRSQGFVTNPAGSEGNLCLSGAIGRYVGPGQIQQAGTSGRIELALDLTMVPQPLGFVPAMAGDTWNFQAWYRDAVGGMATSNFTDGLEVIF